MGEMVTMTEQMFLLNRVVYWFLGLILGLAVSAYIVTGRESLAAWRRIRAAEAEIAASEESEASEDPSDPPAGYNGYEWPSNWVPEYEEPVYDAPYEGGQ